MALHQMVTANFFKKELDEVAEIIGKTMSGIVKLNIPLVVNLKVGANWLEMKDFGTYGM